MSIYQRPKIQFSARITVTREGYKFIFSENMDQFHRRVPSSFSDEGGNNPNLDTIGLWASTELSLAKGDSAVLDCRMLDINRIKTHVTLGAEFYLWDLGFFAKGEVLEIFDLS